MRLVNCDARELGCEVGLLELGEELLRLGDALGCDVEEAQARTYGVGRLLLDRRRLLSGGHVACEQRRTDALALKVVHLVGHEAHER